MSRKIEQIHQSRPKPLSQRSGMKLSYAEKVCAEKSVRLTPIRRLVLEIVLASGEPIGAYEILAQLNKLKDSREAPVTIYRALEFLISIGLVHRVASLNSYIACDHPHHDDGAQLLICRTCGATEEICDKSVESAIAKLAGRKGYTAISPLVEIAGTCAGCREQSL
jgi:Fur family zinc uptake transcriptional regulator